MSRHQRRHQQDCFVKNKLKSKWGITGTNFKETFAGQWTTIIKINLLGGNVDGKGYYIFSRKAKKEKIHSYTKCYKRKLVQYFCIIPNFYCFMEKLR